MSHTRLFRPLFSLCQYHQFQSKASGFLFPRNEKRVVNFNSPGHTSRWRTANKNFNVLMSHSETLKRRFWFSSSGVWHVSAFLSSLSEDPGADATGPQLTLLNNRMRTHPEKKTSGRWGFLGEADDIGEPCSPSLRASDGSGSGQRSSGPAFQQGPQVTHETFRVWGITGLIDDWEWQRPCLPSSPWLRQHTRMQACRLTHDSGLKLSRRHRSESQVHGI